jgi:hypothetical protein
MALKKASVALLATIASAMLAEPFYALATEKEAKELTDGKLAEFNPEIRDGDKIAIRLTDEGLKANTEMNAPASNTGTDNGANTSTATAASSFAIIDGAALPSAARGGRNGPVYPFETLNVGQSFFVPATSDKPEPAKSIASTATSAAKRFANPVKDGEGKPVMETYKVRGVEKTREKYEFTRRFAVK